MQLLVRQITLFFALTLLLGPATSWAEQCFQPDSWLNPKKGEYIDSSKVLEHVQTQSLILLGEHHANEAHHLWHAEMIDYLLQQPGPWAIGLEAFPRSKQPLLEQWTTHKIDEKQFRANLQWDEVWSFPFDYYLPVLYLARTHRIPLIALNVERELVRATGQLGWKQIPLNKREGVDDPATPGKDYIQKLAVSFQRHNTQPIGETQKAQFKSFVAQQLLWDRAMAKGISDFRKNNPDKKVISIVGSWHLIDYHGVPFQLKSLGLPDTTVLIPWDNYLECRDVSAGFSSFIYTPPN